VKTQTWAVAKHALANVKYGLANVKKLRAHWMEWERWIDLRINNMHMHVNLLLYSTRGRIMKLSILISNSLLLLAFTGTAQQISITNENSKELNSFAESIRNIETFFNAGPLPIYVRLFECGRTVGKLNYGADVILYDLYISVKQATDEYPNGVRGYFWVTGHFIDPRNYIFEPESRTLTFDHGTEESTEITTLEISFDSIKAE